MLGLPEDANVQFYRGEGCQECYHTGYKGRRAVFEIFMLNGRIRRMVTEGAKYDALLRAAVETNFVTMRENCRNLVFREFRFLLSLRRKTQRRRRRRFFELNQSLS